MTKRFELPEDKKEQLRSQYVKAIKTVVDLRKLDESVAIVMPAEDGGENLLDLGHGFAAFVCSVIDERGVKFVRFQFQRVWKTDLTDMHEKASQEMLELLEWCVDELAERKTKQLKWRTRSEPNPVTGGTLLIYDIMTCNPTDN